jgi:hypothetical protein
MTRAGVGRRVAPKAFAIGLLGPLLVACGGEGVGESDVASGPVLQIEYGPWTLSPGPVLARGPEGAWDSGLVDPGAMIFHRGRFHMLYNAIPSWPHPLAVGYATSVDGLSWQRASEAAVLAPEEVPFGGWTIRANSLVVEGETWILYVSVGDENRLEGRVGRATAPSPTGPWTFDAEPVLEPGEGDSWDSRAVGDAKVMPDARGYVMYYAGWGADRSAIGRAVSPDGVRWSKDPAPVLEAPIGEADGDEFSIRDPTVRRTPDAGWLMVYRLTRAPETVALGLATSGDGIAWSLDPAGPVTRLEPGGPVDMIWYNNVLTTRTHQLVYIEGGSPGTGNTDVWAVTRELRVGFP